MNGISIGSAVFAQQICVTNTQTDIGLDNDTDHAVSRYVRHHSVL